MPKLLCPCGFVQDLSLIPDDGWITIRDKDYEEVQTAEQCRQALSDAKPETQEWAALLDADAVINSKHGVLYECPRCHRVMWQKPGKEVYQIYKPEA